jgi:hypothetical protein
MAVVCDEVVTGSGVIKTVALVELLSSMTAEV